MEAPEDKYKIFDANEFQSRQVLGGQLGIDSTGIVVFKRHFAFRAALPMLVAALALLLLIVFLLLFGASSGRAGRLQTQVAALQQAQQQTCRSESCLQQAAYLARIMNSSADPCEDFYEFACGNYAKVLPYDHWFALTHVFREMNGKAREDVQLALTRPAQSSQPNWVSKVKAYYYTCLRYYRTYLHGDNPLVSRVFNTTDGLGDFLFGRGVDKVDIGAMFTTVSGRYYIPSLLHSFTWWNDFLHKKAADKRYSIWVGRSRRSVGILRFNLYYSSHQDIYLNFVKDIARLLIRDSGMRVANSDTIVDTFASDVLEVEKKLYSIHHFAYYAEWQNFNSDPPHHPDNMVEVQQLKRRFPYIDFAAYLKQVYGEYQVRDSTKVVLMSEHYLDELNKYFRENNATSSSEFKRKISNYLTWVTAMYFEWDLSPEYRHKFKAIRDINWRTSNPEETAHSFCFSNTEWGMEKALSSLYVREYFSDSGKAWANRLFEQLRTATKRGIDQLAWMQPDTKAKAKAKVDSIVEKAGYPAEAKDDSFLDREYQMIHPHYSDYFQLLLDSLQYRKSIQRSLLDNYNQLDFAHWGKLYDTHFSYHLYDNEILVQAGVLQAPLFSTQLPQQIVYGGYGTLIAHEIIRSFDVIGQLYDQSRGYSRDGWWSRDTLRGYKERTDCVRDSMKDMLNFYEKDRLAELDDEKREKKVKELLRLEVNWTVREMGALKFAREAFRLHKNDGHVPLKLPAFGKSEEQMFYISYAQMNCHHAGWYHDWKSWYLNWYPWKIGVNTVLANTPGFSRLFGCSRGSQMRVESKRQCSVF